MTPYTTTSRTAIAQITSNLRCCLCLYVIAAAASGPDGSAVGVAPSAATPTRFRCFGKPPPSIKAFIANRCHEAAQASGSGSNSNNKNGSSQLPPSTHLNRLTTRRGLTTASPVESPAPPPPPHAGSSWTTVGLILGGTVTLLLVLTAAIVMVRAGQQPQPSTSSDSDNNIPLAWETQDARGESHSSFSDLSLNDIANRETAGVHPLHVPYTEQSSGAATAVTPPGDTQDTCPAHGRPLEAGVVYVQLPNDSQPASPIVAAAAALAAQPPHVLTLEQLEREKSEVTAELTAEYKALQATPTSAAGKGVRKGDVRVSLHAGIHGSRVSAHPRLRCVHACSSIHPCLRFGLCMHCRSASLLSTSVRVILFVLGAPPTLCCLSV